MPELPTATTALQTIKAILQESQRPYQLISPLVSFVEKLIEQVTPPASIEEEITQ